jgi:hypothetical protein
MAVAIDETHRTGHEIRSSYLVACQQNISCTHLNKLDGLTTKVNMKGTYARKDL